MSRVSVEAASADRFADVQHALAGGGDGASCQCQWWTLTIAQFSATGVDDRRRMLRDEIEVDPPPGLVAYVEGAAAGWVRVGPRVRQPRLERTRAFASVSEQPWDDASVWAATCFVVRKEHRGEGVAVALLDAAVTFARGGGARILEAYPIDPEADRRHTANSLFHGVLSTFLSAGFREVCRSRSDRVVVALDLDG
ncbi:GNAT family N-acetyltransferase [Microbacterium aurantiacum]|uniref:Acetyltransferase n=1 Tax=Microbacterium aurantiacum TaxID=162393 RepID=A0A0M8MPV3_9MICO|nr:GNAT family N-acetyltransferase [Microbacterium chocolatum]ANG85479.1 acetyltransferase [Microbacterium chocolatum]KOS11221.1 acetyltransferase [Microbacterium chocolatum]